jgi:phosphatidylglycerophosphatase A
MPPSREFSASALRSPAVWLVTGMGVGLVAPAPATVGAAIWGLPLAWAIGQLPSLGWQVALVVALNAVGVPLCTAAGRALGGQKDHQAIVWDEIATIPMVFLLVPMTSWPIGLVGLVLHRVWDISKTPPAGRLERLPDGWGVMADDWLAGVYAGLSLWAIVWITHAAGWDWLSSGSG